MKHPEAVKESMMTTKMKLARVRVKMSPNPFPTGNPFRRELRLWEGAFLFKTLNVTPGSKEKDIIRPK